MTQHIENVVIGKPLVSEADLFALNEQDFEEVEKDKTIHTEERFLPQILKDCGFVSSTSEVRRNKPQLCIKLDSLDFMEIKWGKKRLWIAVGE